MKWNYAQSIKVFFIFVLLGLPLLVAAAQDDDDRAPSGAAANGLPMLTTQQQRAVGLIVVRAVKTTAPERLSALGLVLDPIGLVADAGDLDSTRAVAHAASAEVDRLNGLQHAGAGTSLKTLETAQADSAKAQAQADAASIKFSARWGALAALPAAQRQKAIAAATTGKQLLVRADLPGRHSLGIVLDRAELDVDGVEVPGHVLGLVAQATSDVQGVGVLVQVDDALPGLAPGARVPVALIQRLRSGMLVPRSAVLYDAKGAFVYKQLKPAPGADKDATRYTPVRVKLWFAQEDNWLVDGIDDDDEIVAHGAGVLWSLQGLAGKSAADDDDD